MFRKVLVANRGEIALRVIRAVKELGATTVAVWSEADGDSLHVRFADEDVCIGPGPARESYLNVPRIMAAAEITGADAIHPGYGFLAENAEFAEICEHHGVTFIGPTAEMIRQMGDKTGARALMRKAGVPVVPGSEGPVTTVEEALAVAEEVGYPVILKASAGGGGRGMRIVREPDEMRSALEMARSEAERSFKSGELYLERYLAHPRHVEFQILGDQAGTVFHLGERDCSIQRRHQKLLEESPSTALTPELRRRMGEVAILGARQIGYVGAGTMEFLLGPDGDFYFMEMNTRIQVEHPVTEMVTGWDLVREQVNIAAGGRLFVPPGGVPLHGHAIEVRVNAEDPERGFLPTPGTLVTFHVPGGPGVRVDTHCYPSYQIPAHYDSLIAKLIVHGVDREHAIQRMRRALDEFVIEGIPTTIPFHRRILRHPRFLAGEIDTHFVEEMEE